MKRIGILMMGVAAAGAACSDTRDDDGFVVSASGTSGVDASATNPGTTTQSAESDPTSTEKLDIGNLTEATAEGGGDMGCEKADFVFVIDNSGSMQDEQANLIASFPGFISTIQSTLMATDYQIMVLDTDATGGGSSSSTCINGECTCEPVPACCELVCLSNNSCNGFDCDNLPGGGCDSELGAGKIFKSDGTQCLSDMGPRFMTDAEPNLGDTFACVAEVGTFGDGNEQPMASLINALTDPLASAGGCNEGFLRDDAILVVTFITDEEDVDKSPGDPMMWHDQVVAAKGGNEDAIVVLGLFGDTDQPNAVCQELVDVDGAEAAPRLRQFVESFGDKGIAGSVCAPDYTPFFQDAVSLIDLTCDEFVPPGLTS